MRRLLLVSWIAVMTGLLPAIARAGNQESANQIAANLKASGQLADYSIGVKYLDGTVWLQGHVRDQDQMNRALQLVFSSGVPVNRVIRDDVRVGNESAKPASASTSESGLMGKVSALNPLRHSDDTSAHAQQVPSSFSSSRKAMPTAMMQAIPAPAPPVAEGVQAPAANGKPAPLPQAAVETTQGATGAPLPMYAPGTAAAGPAPIRYDQPCMPNYAWPSYAAYPNYAGVTYPRQYSPTAWPYIGPFYPYTQVPLGWRKVSLEWDDGWWFLDFKDGPRCAWWR